MLTIRPPMRHAGLLVWAALIASVLLAIGCAHRPTRDRPSAAVWSESRQLVLVTVSDWNSDHGTLRRYERKATGWQPIGDARPVMIGRSGAAWGAGLHQSPRQGPVKREGDGRAPAGVFRIGGAFGYAAKVATALPYDAMQASHYCIDVNESPLYNRIVDTRVVGEQAAAGSTEPMRRDIHADGDERYRLGFVIEHNTEAIPAAGSCIFAHLWKSPTDATAGCTAMDETTMNDLLAWLRPERDPLFVLMPAREYARLQAQWQLPAIQP